MKKKPVNRSKMTVSCSEETVLTREKFFRILDNIIQPIPSKVKQPKKGKKKTSG